MALAELNPAQLETRYIDLVLDGWAAWSASERGPAPPIGAGALLHIKFERHGFYKLRISDDEFTFVDSKIPQLAPRLRQIIELEYRHLWCRRYYRTHQEGKWALIGLRRLAYTQRLTAAQESLYGLLLPWIETWRERDRPCDYQQFDVVSGAEVG